MKAQEARDALEKNPPADWILTMAIQRVTCGYL
jgi:hypothetical protein